MNTNDLWTYVCLQLSNNPRHCRPLQHNHQTGVCPLRVGNYQTFTHLTLSLRRKIDLDPWTEVCTPSIYTPSICSHRSIPRLMPFCHFPLRGVYSPNIQVVTRIPSACSHWSVPHLLHPYGHLDIRPSYPYSLWSDPYPPRDGYTPFLICSASHVNRRGTSSWGWVCSPNHRPEWDPSWG